mgnify:FL=1
MGKQYFLSSTVAKPPILPPERWMLAFPEGEWIRWATLQAAVQADDTVWVPVQHEDWMNKVAALVAAQPACRVVVVSTVPYDAEGLRAVNVGARGYCHQLAVPEMLQEVAQAVQHGGFWLGPDLVQRLVSATRELLADKAPPPSSSVDLSALSDRELQVAKAVAAGKSNKEVAEQLFISERTVKAHLGAVFEKLGVRDRVQLVLLMSSVPTP